MAEIGVRYCANVLICQCANDLFAPPRRSKMFSVNTRNNARIQHFERIMIAERENIGTM